MSQLQSLSSSAPSLFPLSTPPSSNELSMVSELLYITFEWEVDSLLISHILESPIRTCTVPESLWTWEITCLYEWNRPMIHYHLPDRQRYQQDRQIQNFTSHQIHRLHHLRLPRDPVWAKFTATSERRMRCNKCLKIITKKVDRLKAHSEACSVVGVISSDDDEQSEKKAAPAAEQIAQPSPSVNSNKDAGPSDSGLTPSTSSGISHTDYMHSLPAPVRKKHCKISCVSAWL